MVKRTSTHFGTATHALPPDVLKQKGIVACAVLGRRVSPESAMQAGELAGAENNPARSVPAMHAASKAPVQVLAAKNTIALAPSLRDMDPPPPPSAGRRKAAVVKPAMH